MQRTRTIFIEPEDRSFDELYEEYLDRPASRRRRTTGEYSGRMTIVVPRTDSILPNSAQMSRWSTNKFYRQFAPTAQTTSVGQGQGRQGISVRGRDYAGDVTCSFTAQNVGTLNAHAKMMDPSDTDVFPWMGKLAKLFQTYKILDLKIVFEPQVSSITNGLIGIYYDPDPTTFSVDNASKAISWGTLCQKGVNVHGAVWGKHMLSVPQSLVASRNEYYMSDKFPTLELEHKTFGYDPLEYFPGYFGWQVVNVTNPTPDKAGEVTYGKVYIEYTVVFGKADPTTMTVQSAEPQAFVMAADVASSMESACWCVFRKSTGVAIGTPQVLIGAGQKDAVSDQTFGGQAFFYREPSTNALIARGDIEFSCVLSLHGTSGVWNATNAVRFAIAPAGSNTYTDDTGGVLALSNGARVNERYAAGLGTITQMTVTSVKLNAGDKFLVRLLNNGTIAAWSTTSPGYSFRMYANAYDVDAAPYPVV